MPQDSSHLAKPTKYSGDWFKLVTNYVTPKHVESLAGLWQEMCPKQLKRWEEHRGTEGLYKRMLQLLDEAHLSLAPHEMDYQDGAVAGQPRTEDLAKLVEETDDLALYGITKALHIRIMMQQLDGVGSNVEATVNQVKLRGHEEKTAGTAPATSSDNASPGLSSMQSPRAAASAHEEDASGKLLEHALVLQSFLQIFTEQDALVTAEQSSQPGSTEISLVEHIHAVIDRFQHFVSEAVIRLVSTVHPNETLRNVNLRHLTSIMQNFMEWRSNFESLGQIQVQSAEYRLRRERLNNLRRAIKAEIEGLCQSNQLRSDPIPVVSEGRRLSERYKVIFEAYPIIIKLLKRLAKEATYLFVASKLAESKSELFLENFKASYENAHDRQITGKRDLRLRAIKEALLAVSAFANFKPARLDPVVTFGTWRGGDRDGNPFVVASFSNQMFVEQRVYIIEYYIHAVKDLLDKLTPATDHVEITQELADDIKHEMKIFPYIEGIKMVEPYRVKLRFILERLNNTLIRAQEVFKRAGYTIVPLLSQTLPGPNGYNSSMELRRDMRLLYDSLAHNGGKSQARSKMQDLKILTETFGLHMTSIDFRQTSDKNSKAVAEYLKAANIEGGESFGKMSEAAKVSFLLQLLQRTDLEINSSILQALSQISRDTIHTLLIYSDAARTDRAAVGKFIISMCQSVSDILTVLLLLKLVGMASIDSQGRIECQHDICGLFETIEDLKNAPRIMCGLLSLAPIRDYVIRCRNGSVTCMLGYSDSARDGSALSSDAHLAKASIELSHLETELRPIRFTLYRGRGDVIPRGYGGSISKAILSQSRTMMSEDHTEQNRYLRRYQDVRTAVDHLHRVYASHLSAVLRTRKPPHNEEHYQRVFEFFGKMSTLKWNTLVREADGGLGKIYFDLLQKYTILPHLAHSHFASRPVSRTPEGGVTVENIRAIPFTMMLAQMREFTNAYYGSGTSFEMGSALLDDAELMTTLLLACELANNDDKDGVEERIMTLSQTSVGTDPLYELVFRVFKGEKELLSKSISRAKSLVLLQLQGKKDSDKRVSQLSFLQKLLTLYDDATSGIREIARILLVLHYPQQADAKPMTALEMLRIMYHHYAPFRFSVENKESALAIRNKSVVDLYVSDATAEERKVLAETEREAQLTRDWLLKINQQQLLFNKSGTPNLETPELYVLHSIQAKLLKGFRELEQLPPSREITQRKYKMEIYIQLSILALSEGLGFGGQSRKMSTFLTAN